jgi:hypothetical protein
MKQTKAILKNILNQNQNSTAPKKEILNWYDAII